MFLRLKRKEEEPSPQVILYDDGAQQRAYKRLKVEDSEFIFTNCVPLKEIHCPLTDYTGQLVIPQPPRSQTQECEPMDFEYYELDLQGGACLDETALVFEPLVNDDEGEESVYEEDEDDSNGEGYYTNDYPDEYNPRFHNHSNFDPDDYYDESL